jgi:hypothetical protein
MTASRVLHVATGPVAALIFIADTDEGSSMYVGPAFTYYEVIETGRSPQRLTDPAWQSRLSLPTEIHPAAPAWTRSFRWSPAPAPANPWWLIGSVTGGGLGVISLGVYAMGIYRQQRRLLWLGSLLGLGLGLGLLVLAVMSYLTMLKLIIQQSVSEVGILSIDYRDAVYEAYGQTPALFSLFGLLCLFVSLWGLAQSLHQDWPVFSRYGRYISLGAILSLLGLGGIMDFSEAALLVVDSVILSSGASLLILLLLWAGIGYLTSHLIGWVVEWRRPYPIILSDEGVKNL